MKKVAVIMGSDSDLPVVADAIKKLKEFEIPFEVKVLSAHRTPAHPPLRKTVSALLLPLPERLRTSAVSSRLTQLYPS